MMASRFTLATTVATILFLMFAACSGSAANLPPTATPAIQAPTANPGDNAIQSHLATKTLEVGTQRVAFLLNTKKALVDVPQVQISVARAGAAEPIAQLTAGYNAWPYGVRGSYAAAIEFPSAGNYQLAVTPLGGDISGEAQIQLEVRSDTPVPSIGETPPASHTKTLSDALPIADLTTDYEPDEELYRLSVAEAISSRRPTVIVFATPAFCTSPTCGPQVDTVSELRAAHPDAANYIHVELYDNPAEIRGDLSQARLAPAAAEWGFTQLPDWTNESWVFVLDGDGVVRQRFEGFATLTELEAALSQVSRGE